MSILDTGEVKEVKKTEVLGYVVFIWIIMAVFTVSTAIIFITFPIVDAGTQSTTPSPIQQDTAMTTSASYPDVLFFDANMSVEEPLAGKPVYDIYTVAERQNKGLPTQLQVSTTPYYGKKVVYLTFDDGPDSENTPAVLSILKSNNIKATFFVIGTEVEKNPELLKQIYQEGHSIGNHSYNHVYRQLYHSSSDYLQQLHRTDQIIKNIIGVRPNISRAPGGSAGNFTKQYWDALRKEGYVEVGWNVSSGDASRGKAADLVNNVIYQMENRYLWSHAIVLMHDGRGHGETVKALPEIIDFFKSHGYEFKMINIETPPAW